MDMKEFLYTVLALCLTGSYYSAEARFTARSQLPVVDNVSIDGIDLWGIARAGYPGWPAHGGHGSGRKWPIIFAGMLLGDTAMASPNATLPSLRFGEDMQTMYDSCWTGAQVVYAGHQGVIDGKAVSTTPGWGPYEHKHPSQWADSNKIGEDYRRCCTSLSWVGEALAARIMHAVDLWGHDALFDYVDRWMTENDSAAVVTIKAQTGWDYSASWARQGQCWDAFVENMWNAYRDKIPENIIYSPEVNEFKKRRENGFITWRNSRKDIRLYSISGRIISKAALSHSGIVIVCNRNRHIRKQVILPR
jgi:hypothetical protein